MAYAHSSHALQTSLISRLIEPANHRSVSPSAPALQSHSGVVYRSSPDGSVTMGKDVRSKQVALIVQNASGHWDVALPAQVEQFGGGNQQPSLEVAQQMVDAAFAAYHATAGAG